MIPKPPYRAAFWMRVCLFGLFGIFMSIGTWSQQSTTIPTAIEIGTINLKTGKSSAVLPFDVPFKLRIIADEKLRLRPEADLFNLYSNKVSRKKVVRCVKKMKKRIYEIEHRDDIDEWAESVLKGYSSPFIVYDIYKKCPWKYERDNTGKKRRDLSGAKIYSANIRPPQLRIEKYRSSDNYFAYIGALKPNRNYEIVLAADLSESEKEELYRIATELDGTNNGSISVKLDDFRQRVESTALSTLGIGSNPKGMYGLPTYIKNISKLSSFKSELTNEFKILAGDSVISSTQWDISDLKLQMAVEEGVNLLLDDIDCLLLLDSIDVYKDDLKLGVRALGAKSTCSMTQLIQRSKNYSETIKALDKIYFRLLKLSSVSFNTIIDDLKNEVVKAREDIAKRAEIFNASAESLYRRFDQEYGKALLVSGTSSANELKTRVGTFIVPDFGIVLTRANDIKGECKSVPRPYFGVNFHFRGTNMDIPFRQLQSGKFWNRTSIMVGVTLGEITEFGFEDFFGKTSLMVGCGFRVLKYIRLNTGTTLLRRLNENPTISKSEGITGFFLSLSVDFRIYNVIGEVSNKLF